MNIFLVRHGHSENDRSDFERVLSKKGILEVESLAAKLLEIEQIRPRKIIHSGLYRARETASIIKEKLNLPIELGLSENLCPNSPINFWDTELLKSIEDTMLVGHMPFMGLMAQRLLDSSSGPSFNASFETASLVWITKETESELKFVRYINGL